MPDGAGEDVISINVLSELGDISAEEWDSCAAPECADGGRPLNPAATHRFLSALEESNSVAPRQGWAPRHLVARADDTLIGVMPLYAKGHSQGEYVFDYAWANAYERAGGDYYPKLLSAIPFTPVTGPRLLTRPDGPLPEESVQAALVQGAVQVAAEHDYSSVHINFCTEREWLNGAEMGLLRRQDQQFHWLNDGYADFDAFLATLASRKRKQIRKERKTANACGVEIVSLTGGDIEPEHWDAFWRFYQDTGSRKWGTPYLTRDFFEIAQQNLRDDILLVMGRRDGAWVAGAMNLIGRETLFGRYWGCIEDHPCLHFETCYYRAIDWAVAHGLKRVEAGAQGAHKLARGYMPTATHSLHWIADSGFRRAVAQYLDEERAAVANEIEYLATHGPFRNNEGDKDG